MNLNSLPAWEHSNLQIQIAILAVPETLDEHEESPDDGPNDPDSQVKSRVGDEGIDGNEESIPDEEKPEHGSDEEMFPVQVWWMPSV